MSKTFGQLGAGDEVYIIKDDCSLEIAKVTKVEPSPFNKEYRLVVINGIGYTVSSFRYHFRDCMECNVYCDIDDAMRKMQDICANVLHNYRNAIGALNKLETKKKMI